MEGSNRDPTASAVIEECFPVSIPPASGLYWEAHTCESYFCMRRNPKAYHVHTQTETTTARNEFRFHRTRDGVVHALVHSAERRNDEVKRRGITNGGAQKLNSCVNEMLHISTRVV